MRAFRGSPRASCHAAVSWPLHRSTSCPAQLCSLRAAGGSSSCTAQPLSCLSCVSSLSSVQSNLPKLRLASSLTTAETSDIEGEEDVEAKSEEYTATMNQKMGGYLTYVHEDGINYANILDDIMVGSCLQTAADVDRRAGPGTTLDI